MKILFGLVLISFAFFYQYYKNQNNKQTIGGAISKAKVLWLGYAVFNYFVFSVWLYCQTPVDHAFHGLLTVALLLFYCRFVVQAVLMFVLKKWQPPMGMAYNVLCVITLGILLVKTVYNIAKTNILGTAEGYPLYFVGLILTLITDTYYAHSFFKIVGKKTMGADAIWYASDEDPQFQRINCITARLNVFFYGLTLVVIVLYFK